MAKRLCLSLTLAMVAILLVAVPVLAAYYAYIYVEESAGNSYEELPLICSLNITPLVEGGFISSTGLDTRVITGDGATLPHMLANDKILFVSDLAAYEDKTLIFYLGASSLSSFPIIVGYNGSITTPQDPDLEMSYVFEVLTSGYFDTSAGSDKNMLCKEEALKAWISDEDTLRVATFNSSDDEQWALEYDGFTTGEHVVYIVGNGLLAHLYVDNMVTAKDTENLYESSNALVSNSQSDIKPNWRSSFYAAGKYWAFYDKSYNTYTANIYYKTSVDGSSWSSEYTISTLATYVVQGYSVALDQDGYMHLAYSAHKSGAGNNDYIKYRRGVPESDNSITWSAAEQTAVTITDDSEQTYGTCVMVDSNGYPFIVYGHYLYTSDKSSITKSSVNNGTWSTAGGYPFVLISEGYYHDETATSYPSSNKIYALWGKGNGVTNELVGRYYNGVSWAGSTEAVGSVSYNNYFNAVADDDDNVYIVWEVGSNSRLRIRYADGTFSSTVSLTGWTSPSVSYNDDNGYIYITGIYGSSVAALALANGELSGIGTLFTPASTVAFLSTTPYGDHIGIMYSSPTDFTQHGYISFPYDWNANSNNWTWMQGNVMAYADYIIFGVDGELVLTYQPDTIIQGTTLPDEVGDHDGIITWGSNPSGVDVSHSELMCEAEDDEGTSYYYFDPGSQDIIKPEPEIMSGDVDLERLRGNPLYPLVQMLTIEGFLTERLVWLGLAWLIVIIAMLGVHLGFDTRKSTEKPQHFILTTITGLGLSILFYTMGIFPLWVIFLMALGLVGAIIWERQPVM